MKWNVLRLLYVHELRMLLRARRTVVLAVVLAAIIMTLMLYAQKYSVNRRERLLTGTTYRYTVTGPLADRARVLLNQTRTNLSQHDNPEHEKLRQFKFVETNVANPTESLKRNEIQFYIETLNSDDADKLPPKKESATRPGATRNSTAQRLSSVPLINIVYSEDRDASDNAHDQIMSLLRLARQTDSQVLLTEHGFPGDPKQFFSIEDSSIATHGQVTGSIVGRLITLFLVMMMFTGGAVASMDIISGEKERGTLETLLTTAAGRSEIVAAKQLAITSVALVITLIQGLNFLLYIQLKVIALPKDFDLQLPTGMALTLLLLFIPLAATIASVLLMIS